MNSICEVRGLRHRYGDHLALDGFDFEVAPASWTTLLGPNGCGKTTLFRVLCTLLPVQQGRAVIDGLDVANQVMQVRRRIGIVFQSPSLDGKLTVEENLRCKAALQGIRGGAFRDRSQECLRMFGLVDRRHDRCETLSGGLRRRVELAGGLLHRPRLLLMDEPSTGLDPAARLGLADAIGSLKSEGVTVIMTTHLMEEAEKSDRVIIMADGKRIADGPPVALRREVGGDLITIVPRDTAAVASILENDLHLEAKRVHNQFRVLAPEPAGLLPELMQRLGDQADSVTIGKPSLEDVFVAKTGKRFE
ncbi:MAG: ATP-binding cassette domain-containing protein [Planctomycetota bacterium]